MDLIVALIVARSPGHYPLLRPTPG